MVLQSRVKRFSWLILPIVLAACATQPQATTQTDTTAQPVATTQTGDIDTIAPAAGKVIVDGSSTVYPITSAIAKNYSTTAEGGKAPTDVQFSGTSAGFRKFCAGETDISNASRPILVKEMEACNQAGVRFIELPVAFDALTIAVNPANTWAADITIAELKKMWEPAAQGKITNWKQIRASYPDRPLKLFGAGKDSGTFDYFNEVVMGDPKQTRTDYTGSEDDEVIAGGIKNDPAALGYLPFAYFERHDKELKALGIDSGRGAVVPTRETVETAKYQPFSRPLFIYVNAKSVQTKPEVQAFVDYYLKNAKAVVPQVGYVPLPEEGYRLATLQFQRGEIGTVFQGVPQPDVTIEELLRRQAVFQLNADAVSAPTK
jgi:phosphate transport system substrate-binding protein